MGMSERIEVISYFLIAFFKDIIRMPCLIVYLLLLHRLPCQLLIFVTWLLVNISYHTLYLLTSNFIRSISCFVEKRLCIKMYRKVA